MLRDPTFANRDRQHEASVDQVADRTHGDLCKIATIGTFIPRRCGIATFTSDLLESISRQLPEVEHYAIALSDVQNGYDYPAPVRFEIRQRSRADYNLAIDVLNMNQPDIVSLQHEYGIYGGEQGSYVLDLLQNLRLPIVTTLHTVLPRPSDRQREIMKAIGVPDIPFYDPSYHKDILGL